MSASVPTPFPLVGLHAVANTRNEWVAAALHVPQDSAAGLAALLQHPEALSALAPLDIVIALDDPRRLSAPMRAALPASRVVLRLPLAPCGDPEVQEHCRQLSDEGYRVMLDGVAGPLGALTGARALSFDCAVTLPPLGALYALPGPHLARRVGSAAQLAACRAAGFAWFSGDYALQRSTAPGGDDGTTRKRLVALLGLVSRDADSRALENLVKQDPALGYHLLKLVNSAAFAPSSPISSFAQAINILGRRQLQRWLQLLLYARQSADGSANPLLPLAAARAALMEALCLHHGGDRDAGDRAFLTGVFSLLDVLLDLPMAEILGALSLDAEVVQALLARQGRLGALLALAEHSGAPAAASLDALALTPLTYWSSLTQAYQWALQVSRSI